MAIRSLDKALHEACEGAFKMNKKIFDGDEVFAILASMKDVKDGREWFGENHEPLQAARMSCKAGTGFRVHRHILNPRTIKYTQEAFIVVKGKIAVDIYDKFGNLLGSLQAQDGEAVFVYRGCHGVRVLDDAVFYELKAGQYTVVSEDKEFIKEQVPPYEQMR